jgi:hypothetical protein
MSSQGTSGHENKKQSTEMGLSKGKMEEGGSKQETNREVKRSHCK